MIVRISGNKSKRDEVDRLFFFSRINDYSVLFRVLFLFSSSLYSYINVHGKSRANIARVLWKSTAHYVVFLSSSFNWWRNQQRNDNRTRFPPHVPAGCQHTVSPLYSIFFSNTWCMCIIRVYFVSLSLCVFVHNLYLCREMCERQNAVVYRAHCVYCVHAICYVHVYRNCQFTTVIRPHFVWCSFFYVFVFIQLS